MEFEFFVLGSEISGVLETWNHPSDPTRSTDDSCRRARLERSVGHRSIFRSLDLIESVDSLWYVKNNNNIIFKISPHSLLALTLVSLTSLFLFLSLLVALGFGFGARACISGGRRGCGGLCWNQAAWVCGDDFGGFKSVAFSVIVGCRKRGCGGLGWSMLAWVDWWLWVAAVVVSSVVSWVDWWLGWVSVVGDCWLWWVASGCGDCWPCAWCTEIKSTRERRVLFFFNILFVSIIYIILISCI